MMNVILSPFFQPFARTSPLGTVRMNCFLFGFWSIDSFDIFFLDKRCNDAFILIVYVLLYVFFTKSL